MVGKEPTLSPSNEHKQLQTYLMEETPLNVAIAQSGIFYLSPAYRLALNLYNELLAKEAKQKDKSAPESQSEFSEGSDKKKEDPNKLTEIEEEFLLSMKGLVIDLVLSTTLTPGRQKIEKALIKTLEKFGSVNYHIQQRGGLGLPDDPMSRGNKKS